MSVMHTYGYDQGYPSSVVDYFDRLEREIRMLESDEETAGGDDTPDSEEEQ